MRSSPLIERTQRAGLTVLSLQSPPRNALTPTLLEALLAELEQTRKAGTRAILLRSNLADFCGGDGAGAPEIRELLAAFRRFALPIVAAVRGECVNGGHELALACDFVVASKTAQLRRIEVRRAHTPEELEQQGLLNLVVADERVEDTAMLVAQQLAAGPTLAHIATKKLSFIAQHEGIRAADAAMAELQRPLWASTDLKLGLAALKATGMPGTAGYQGR